jgi:ferritin-like metal-binding protein YciE
LLYRRPFFIKPRRANSHKAAIGGRAGMVLSRLNTAHLLQKQSIKFVNHFRRRTDMSLKNLEDLFMDVLKDTLDAERQITKALPKMAKAVESEDLRAAFEEHLSVTETQIERLETIFKSMDKAARGKHCPGMEGLLKEGSELIEKEEPGPALDAALIAAAQKVEHYEIASYGTLATYAKLLEMDEALELLVQTLEEEKQTDEGLTSLASEINLMAEQEAK